MPVVDGPKPALRAATASSPDLDGDLTLLLGVGFKNSTVAMLLIDADHLVRGTNAVAESMFGGTELIGRSILDLYFPDSNPRPDLASVEERAARPGGAETWATMLSDSGEPQPVRMRWHCVSGQSGASYYLVQLWHLRPPFGYFAADLLPQVTAVMMDRELRIMHVAGKATGSGRYDSSRLVGRLLSDYASPSMLQQLEPHYRAALAGQQSSFDYTSPVDAANYRVTAQPVMSNDGEILGTLAIIEDVTADRVRRNMLEQMHQLSRLGTGSYSLAEGWAFGKDLLALVGVDEGQQVLTAMDLLVVPEDRDHARAEYRRILSSGGQCRMHYRLIHGRTGELRYMDSALEAMVDADGRLIRANITLADVTQAVHAEMTKATAAQDRTALIRRISDVLTKPTDDPEQLMQTIADVVTAALGDCTVLSVLTPDGLGVETGLVSVRDDSSAAAVRVVESLLDLVEPDRPVPAGADPVPESHELVSSIDNDDWHDDFEKLLGHPTHQEIQHFVSAPIRHDGELLGFLRIFRFDRDNPYQPGDDDVLLVLADRIGAIIAERRVRDLLRQQQNQALAIAEHLNELTTGQRELLEQLAGVEERERTLLAIAIHDGPMQSIVAVMMRLEDYSAQGTSLDLTAAADLVDLLETSVQRLRTLIIALTPPDLEAGLRPALELLALGIFTGTRTQITATGPLHVPLTPLRKGNAHRILREALVNVRKHAHAEHVAIELEQVGELVVARIVDDGVGAIKFDAGPGHLGMATMRARAAAEGGQLKVESTQGVGTTLTLIMPINVPTDQISQPSDSTEIAAPVAAPSAQATDTISVVELPG